MGVSLGAIERAEQVRVSYGHARPPWAFDTDAITDAARTLGVTSPIELCPAEYRRGRWGGMYSWDRARKVHRIRVKRASSPASASRILWHELTHAAQQDRGERDDGGTYAWGGPRTAETLEAYRDHPREIEARESEAQYGHIPLVRAR